MHPVRSIFALLPWWNWEIDTNPFRFCVKACVANAWRKRRECVAEARAVGGTTTNPTTMKPKPNWNEIEGRIDFGRVNEKLSEYAASGAGRRKRSDDLLDKVKEALLKARSDGVSYRALAAFLNDNGLPVSEPTLRQYLRAQSVGKTLRIKKSKRQSPSKTQEPKAQPAQPAQLQNPQSSVAVSKPETQPVREPWTRPRRGPRIADVNNL